MLLFSQNDRPPPKNIVTITRLQNYISEGQPPGKKEPFRTISEAPACHTLDLVTSASYPQDVLVQILQQGGTLNYARVYMKLIDIVSGDFFAEHIKTGNVLMISEGRAGNDETYSLRDGVLRLEILKPTFERLGLEGKPIMGPGRKHTKARYLVEINLRLPSMVRGKKGFERVLWAFKNVLVDSKSWLFYNVGTPGDLTGPIKAFAPIVRKVEPSLTHHEMVQVPEIDLRKELDEEDAIDLQEWLSLATLQSPRVRGDDKIDPYLCRYSMPMLQATSEVVDEEVPEEDADKVDEDVEMAESSIADREATGIRQTRWRGLICPDFVKALFMLLIKNAPKASWVAITAHAFDGDSYTTITKDKRTIVYHYKD